MQKIESWQAENQQAMHGWDFSHLNGRWHNDPLPWHYRELVADYLDDSKQWLDVDTGGGELMQTFRHPADKTVVTEGWAPNLALLRREYEHTSLTIIPDPDENLSQVPDATFDVISNSHGTLPVPETVAKLRQEGIFITQQVGATNNFGLSRFLNPDYVPAFPDNTLLNICVQLQDAGMTILKQAGAFSKMTFYDVGALVYYATVIPWEFPNFSVTTCLPKLQHLDRLIAKQGAITTFEDRFMIVAKKTSK